MKLPYSIFHLFVPHTRNNHRAKLRQPLGVLCLAILALSFPVWLKAINVTSSNMHGQVLGVTSTATAEQILQLTNQEREKYGAKSLTLDSQLSKAALEKGQDMIANNYWAHVSPSGVQPWDFISDNNYDYLYAGENLARDFSDASSAMKAWMESRTHRENILNPNYQDTGIAIVYGELNGTETILIVQEFGRRRQPTANAPVLSGSDNTLNQAHSNALPAVAPTQTNTSLATSFQLTKSWSIAVAILFGFVLITDISIIARNQIQRVAGRSLAHLAFITMILFAIISTYPGFIK